jgi:hypothetical protein
LVRHAQEPQVRAAPGGLLECETGDFDAGVALDGYQDLTHIGVLRQTSRADDQDRTVALCGDLMGHRARRQ